MTIVQEDKISIKIVVFVTQECLIKHEDVLETNVYGEYACFCARAIKLEYSKQVSEIRFCSKAMLLEHFNVDAWTNFRNKVTEYVKANPDKFVFNAAEKVTFEL